jgi:hypothetical protein
MRIDQSRNRQNSNRNCAVGVSAEVMRDRCSFWLGKIVQPIAAHEISKKAIDNKAVRLTGLGPRRIEKLRLGYIREPKATEYEILRTAFAQWREAWKDKGLADHDSNEAEHAAHLRAAMDYSATRWQRVSRGGERRREMGAPSSDAAGSD